eukprot:1213224-Pleurochrysis_carterae.AAC.3
MNYSQRCIRWEAGTCANPQSANLSTTQSWISRLHGRARCYMVLLRWFTFCLLFYHPTVARVAVSLVVFDLTPMCATKMRLPIAAPCFRPFDPGRDHGSQLVLRLGAVR